MNYESVFKLSERCGFTIVETNKTNHWSRGSYVSKETQGSFTAPEKNIYFSIPGKPSRKGTIGKLVNMEMTSKYSSVPDQFYIGFDDRKTVLKFNYHELHHEEEHEGSTVYKYTQADPQKRAAAKPITNRFGQTLEIDDLVVGIGGRYGRVEIVFGYVSRWTEAGTLFIKPYGPFGSITNSTKGDVKIKDAKQCIRLPKDAKLEEDLFTCVIGADYK